MADEAEADESDDGEEAGDGEGEEDGEGRIGCCCVSGILGMGLESPSFGSDVVDCVIYDDECAGL